ncbi:MAG: fructuronate reductase [Granulosicoccus sp.]
MTQWPVSSGYDPANSQVGIVHIGPGAFHRAHQAVFTDDALAQFGGDWRILGVSLRSATTAQKLNAQNGLYTLVVRPDKLAMPSEYRVIGSVTLILAPDVGVASVLTAMARPETRIVSLTITEKAYCVNAAKGSLDIHDPQIAADLANSKAPTGAIGLITRALQMRYEAGHAPFSVMSCDNLPDNGRMTRTGVLAFAQHVDPMLASWIRENVSFPSTMVDRITPATTQALCDEVYRETGRLDRIPVETEPFSQWVVEDNFCNGRPAWGDVGALLVKDVRPYEQMKLRMLNGAHSMLAYAGFLAGHRYVRDVLADAALSRLVARHINAAGATLDPLDGVNFKEYAQTLLLRFSNPNIAHETYQIAMDGSQKMPQRIFEPALVALDRGTDVDPFAFAIACWIQYLSGAHKSGESYEIRDPRGSELSRACEAGGQETNSVVSEIFALPDLVPLGLVESISFQLLVCKHLDVMRSSGMNAAITKMLTENTARRNWS